MGKKYTTDKIFMENGSLDINSSHDGSDLTVLSISSSGQTTFNNGQITLGGTGRIQGVDYVNADTDAANKAYVDAAVSAGGGSDALSFDFPVKAGQTISEGNFVMLNNSGSIFKVESTGTVPITMPIGSGAQYSQTKGPSSDRDNLVRFVDDNENFILLFSGPYPQNLIFQGGNVDNLGNFTYLNPPSIPFSAQFMEFDIDEATFGLPTVEGCCSWVEMSSTTLYGMAFEYEVSTQTFNFGPRFTFGPSEEGSSRSAGMITNVGSRKYILAAGRNQITGTFIITVTNLTITKHPTTNIPYNNSKGHFVKISNAKVIFCVLSGSYNMDAYIFDISGPFFYPMVTVGNKSSSTWQNYNFSSATRKTNSANMFYLSSPPTQGNNHFISQQTYDDVNDVVVFNNNRLELDTNLYITDLSFYPVTNVLIASGAANYSIPSAAIIDFATSSIINKTVGVSSGNHVGMGMNSYGDVVFNYNSGDPMVNASQGTTSYGRLGDILSNLDPSKTIGVASDSLGNVKISGSVITREPPFDNLLTINAKVYVDGLGNMSTTPADGSLYIGFAISSNSFILEVSR